MGQSDCRRMRTYIAPIGYDSTRVTRPVLSSGFGADDRLLVLRPHGQSDDERATEALNDVRRMVTQLEPSFEMDVIEVPFDDFHAAILQCVELVQRAAGEVTVVLGGGARDIYFPLGVAALTQRDTVETILQFSDITGEVRELSIPNFYTEMTDSQRETLVTLSEASGPITLSNLNEKVGRSKSTIARHVTQFEDAGFVETDFEGRSKVIEFTSAGEVYLAVRYPST